MVLKQKELETNYKNLNIKDSRLVRVTFSLYFCKTSKNISESLLELF